MFNTLYCSAFSRNIRNIRNFRFQQCRRFSWKLLLSNNWNQILDPQSLKEQKSFISQKMAPKSALAILANGTEEMEIVIIVNVLRRAGINVTVAGLMDDNPVKCSRDVVILPDKSLSDVSKDIFDVVILPGGLGGTEAFIKSPLVGELLKCQESNDRWIAAICAAPLALSAHKIGLGKSLTSYPSTKDKLASDYKYVDDQTVVQDGKLITSRGPGTTFKFGLKIAEALVGIDKAQEVAKGLLFEY